MDKIKLDVQEKGDLGIVAEASRSTQRTMFAPPKLTVQAVFSKLKDIAGMTGNSVSRHRYSCFQDYLVPCLPWEFYAA